MLTIHLRQTQDDAPFLTPLTIEIVTAQGAQRITVKPTGKETVIPVPIASRPSGVRIDPDEMILKEVVAVKELAVPKVARLIPDLLPYSTISQGATARLRRR